jgi:hypothetical protein
MAATVRGPRSGGSGQRIHRELEPEMLGQGSSSIRAGIAKHSGLSRPVDPGRSRVITFVGFAFHGLGSVEGSYRYVKFILPRHGSMSTRATIAQIANDRRRAGPLHPEYGERFASVSMALHAAGVSLPFEAVNRVVDFLPGVL